MADNSQHTTICLTTFAPINNISNTDACLVRIYPYSIGEGIIQLPLNDITIGREKNCHIQLDDLSVSRHHATIHFSETGYSIKDLNSSNSTYINDAKINQRNLDSGDLIRIGHTIFKFLYSGHIEKQYHEVIYSMMITDGLTNIHNKRFFMDMLEREVIRSKRHHRPLSLILFDIDHFKKINDTYGHLAGDKILRDLCQRIHPFIRDDEVFARYGGEEFAILLPEADCKKARSVSKKLLMVINKNDFVVELVNIPITISMGVAQMTSDIQMTADDLINAADNMLYAAKQNGRNCIMT